MARVWLGIGFLGQIAFTGRFLMQWLASERVGRSVVPFAFWILSLVGSGLLLLYALHRRDPVFTIGQGTGIAIYLRNVVLIRRQQEGSASEA